MKAKTDDQSKTFPEQNSEIIFEFRYNLLVETDLYGHMAKIWISPTNDEVLLSSHMCCPL